MSIKKQKYYSGVTIVEIMAAILLLSVAVLGAGAYRYYSAMDARKADMHMTGARIALLLCEGWRGVQGSESYDPVAYLGSDLTLTETALPEQIQTASGEGFTVLGGYTIESNGIEYYSALSWKDVDSGLRALNVIVGRSQTRRGESVGHDTAPLPTFKLFTLTTYAEL